jgi:hypothetical protein
VEDGFAADFAPFRSGGKTYQWFVSRLRTRFVTHFQKLGSGVSGLFSDCRLLNFMIAEAWARLSIPMTGKQTINWL